jgi:hypothetical protein
MKNTDKSIFSAIFGGETRFLLFFAEIEVTSPRGKATGFSTDVWRKRKSFAAVCLNYKVFLCINLIKLSMKKRENFALGSVIFYKNSPKAKKI